MSATLTNKDIWLAVAQGGRWTLEEIQQQVPREGKAVARALYAMTQGRMLTRYEGTPPKYGVTPDCITPRMTTVAELMEAMGQ